VQDSAGACVQCAGQVALDVLAGRQHQGLLAAADVGVANARVEIDIGLVDVDGGERRAQVVRHRGQERAVHLLGHMAGAPEVLSRRVIAHGVAASDDLSGTSGPPGQLGLAQAVVDARPREQAARPGRILLDLVAQLGPGARGWLPCCVLVMAPRHLQIWRSRRIGGKECSSSSPQESRMDSTQASSRAGTEPHAGIG
jgi:hypothetical protein